MELVQMLPKYINFENYVDDLYKKQEYILNCLNS